MHVAQRLKLGLVLSSVLGRLIFGPSNVQIIENGSTVLQRGFSLWNALYFYAATIGYYCVASRCIYLLSTVVVQYLPLALVAQQMARLMG